MAQSFPGRAPSCRFLVHFHNLPENAPSLFKPPLTRSLIPGKIIQKPGVASSSGMRSSGDLQQHVISVKTVDGDGEPGRSWS